MRLHLRQLTAATLLALVGLFLQGSLLTLAPGHAQGELVGDVPIGGGFALVVWGGGSPESLVERAGVLGCAATAQWVAVDGLLLGYIDRAPPLVNQGFIEHFSSGSIPGGTAVVLVCGTPTPPLESPLRAPPSLDEQFGSAVFAAVNGARSANGLAPLVLDNSLRVAAENYARLLLTRSTLDHGLDGEPWDRALRTGYSSALVGEVLALSGSSEPLDVAEHTRILLNSWMTSQGHRDILMGKSFAFSELGVGCATGKDARGLNVVICVGMTGIP
jgi:uncharacterized protein YkwD